MLRNPVTPPGDSGSINNQQRVVFVFCPSMDRSCFELRIVLRLGICGRPDGWSACKRGLLFLVPPSDWRPFSGRVAILGLLPFAAGSVVTNNPDAWIDLWLCSCYFFLHDATKQYKASSAQFRFE